MSSSRHQVYVRRSSSPSLSPSSSPSPSPSLNRRFPLLDRYHARSSSSSSSLSSLSTSTSASISSGAAILPEVVPESPSACCSGQFGEVAGGTAAECAAICCCCPCGLVNLLVLTIYKLPAGLYRRAIRRKRRERLIKKGLLPARASRRCRCGCDDTEIHIHPAGSRREDSGQGGKEWMFLGIREDSETEDDRSEADAMVSLEKEMWETFYGTGFWRSPSQREALPPLPPTAPAAGRRPTSSSSPSKTKLL